MKEKKQSISIPVGKSKHISIMNGTQELKSFYPDPNADVVIDITITEIFENK